MKTIDPVLLLQITQIRFGYEEVGEKAQSGDERLQNYGCL